jgi:hypothetical protein
VTTDVAATNLDIPHFDPRADYNWSARHEAENDRVRQELHRRLDLAMKVENNPKMKAAALELARRDFAIFCNNWAWTYDPRNVGKDLPSDIPFSLRPRQEDLATWLDERLTRQENGLVEKSRDEGLTWLLSAYFVHKWLFTPGFKAGIGSRKLELVDNKDNMDAIFPKIRFIIRLLPPWMTPEGFKERLHDKWCRIINPVTGSSITGEGGDNIGRGGRNTIYFVDEHAQLANADMVDHALSQNTECVIYGSTPFGVGNLFYQKRHDKKTPVFTLDWRQNPAKNFFIDWHGQQVFPWYELQKSKYDAVTIAAEVDIDYQASVSGILIPAKYIGAAMKIKLDVGGKRAAGLDVSDSLSGEGDATIWGYREGGNVMDVRVVDESNLSQKALHVISLSKHAQIQHLYYDRVGVGAGIRAVLEQRDDLPFLAHGIVANSKPSSTIYSDDPKYKAKFRFRNRGSELWWSLMLRFRRTYERLHENVPHPDDECISLGRLTGHPDFQTIVNQLSQPTVLKDGSDKIKVDKMGAGSKSPDYAEMLMLLFAHGEGPGIMVLDKPDWI